jgi:hypothetical protein
MIWHAIAPIKAATIFGEEGIFNANSEALDNLHDASRAELDLLDRFVDRDSTELLVRAKSVTSELRTLVRALSSRSDDWSAKYNAIIKAHKELEDSNEQFRRELSLVTGDPLPDDLIESLRKEREQSQD